MARSSSSTLQSLDSSRMLFTLGSGTLAILETLLANMRLLRVSSQSCVKEETHVTSKVNALPPSASHKYLVKYESWNSGMKLALLRGPSNLLTILFKLINPWSPCCPSIWFGEARSTKVMVDFLTRLATRCSTLTLKNRWDFCPLSCCEEAFFKLWSEAHDS